MDLRKRMERVGFLVNLCSLCVCVWVLEREREQGGVEAEALTG